MNKYIRTKDNKIVKVDVEDGIFTSKYELVGEPKNAIEELCDMYVCIYNGRHEVIYNDFEYVKAMCLYDTIYAAIWTDKGLIYVAKTNDKGELELI